LTLDLGDIEMKKRKKSDARKWLLGLLAGVSSIAVFASCAPALAAADAETKAEIRALKEQLKRLEQRLESQAQSQRQTERKVERVEHATVEAAARWPYAPREQGWRAVAVRVLL
jgi:septal ring factor EnvC (AmiA/AmiB activator)